MSGKWKKMIWMICMVQLCVIHGAVLGRLWIRYERRWLFIFGAGAAVMAVYQYLAYRSFIRESVRGLEPIADEGIQAVFAQANAEAGNGDGAYYIYSDKSLKVPFVLGVFRQAVILPEGLGENENLPMLLAHECRHMKEHDTLYKYGMLCMNCFLWFHPLAYLLRHISYRDIEISCDEAVVAGKSATVRAKYGEFLLESAKNLSEDPARNRRKNPISAYWYNSRTILKSRIRAVMEPDRRWDGWAKAAVVALLLEAAGLLYFSAGNVSEEYRESTMPVNEFEGTEAPPIYTEEVIAEMVKLPPAVNDRTFDYESNRKAIAEREEKYPKTTFAEIEALPDSPWQYRVEEPSRLEKMLHPALERFWYYMEEQERFSNEQYERNPSLQLHEMAWRELLAGDMEDAVWGVIWRRMIFEDAGEFESYRQGYGITLDREPEYLYYSMAVHIKMTEPYLYSVKGFADLDGTVEAFAQAYPEEDFSWIPRLDTGKYENMAQNGRYPVTEDRNGNLFVELPADMQEGVQGGAQEKLQESIRVKVPLTAEELQDDGNPISWKGAELEGNNLQCDRNKIIFAYRDGQVVKTLFYEDGEWKESQPCGYGLIKKYITFPENDRVGYLFGVSERLVWQESCMLFRTVDGGHHWERVEMGENAAFHSLTMDFGFLTETEGYLSIHTNSGEEEPRFLRTEDGGVTWEKVTFDHIPEMYCQAYVPEMHGDTLALYIDMEDYGKYEGEKAYYESTDHGKSWSYKGQVFRQ